MRHVILTLILLVCMIPSVFAETRPGIQLPAHALRESATRYHDNGAIERAYLTDPLPIQGRVYKGWCWFDDDGFLHQGVLAEATPLGERMLPAGSTLLLDADRPDRITAWLAHNMTLDGLPVDGGGKIETGFYADGRLRFVVLRHDTVIQTIPCEGGVMTPVEFDPYGRLVRCTLQRSTEIGGVEFAAGTEVWVDLEGNVVRSVPHGWWERLGRDVMDLIF